MIQDTSMKAYREDVLPTLSQKLSMVFKSLGAMGEATNLELSSYMGWPINTITPKIYELRHRGLVVDVGKRPCKVTGRTAYVWTIKPEQPTLL